jgi:thymidylate synthase (FAD)
MRHRINSYNEISYRYVKPPLEFYIPKTWRLQDNKNKQSSWGSIDNPQLTEIYRKSLEDSYRNLEKLLELGVCREQARGLLPLCTYTEFIYTCNLTSLMHFIRLRTHEGAQFEIRQYAEALLTLAFPHFPASLGFFKERLGRPYEQPHVADNQRHDVAFTKLLT